MKKYKFKSLLIIIINLPFIFFLLIIGMEIFGMTRLLTNKIFNIENITISKGLESTQYYKSYNKNTNVLKDPYAIVTGLYFHPYYILSAPWKKADEKLKRNEVVNIGNDNFREGVIDRSKKKAIFTGGSVAFGHFSTSDKTTIPSYLSLYSKYNFKNLGQPSWNSTQELISLLKHNQDYDLSISFSLANDLFTFCVNKSVNYEIIDAPEKYFSIEKFMTSNDLLNSFYINKFKNNISNSLKLLTYKFLPDTYNFLQIYKRFYSSDYITFESTPDAKNCTKYKDEILFKVLENQNKMYEISKSRNSQHIFIIQPFLHLHKNYNFLADKDYIKLEKDIINSLMTSSFCKKTTCLDLSDFFDNSKYTKILLYDPGYRFCQKNCFKKDFKYANHNKSDDSFKNNFFVDGYHLTDNGNLEIAKYISQFIK